ncbi:MAG: FAD-binding and (Fe-S)-binding domain-containing protein [Winkia neuii]|nr:FAD-binding and (Fe-S)-binding domain-containing protein [Winkia neuii]OFJ70657.1 oxidoreductase [Actinomyces sp. HMSC064C12]OFK02674.1 oxidoreductase [Actinomyces sp. HMSC072A03]OFT54182.1 oxidoreductase [Actinomyces sp. HMSC06A08]MDK8099390.1 FAD-binding and (Fe-S)-binding domain-containing protein [Winkia neuii]MDU3134502.1 FAD-binding and (Fe-S)-binding domain-containing protein [Winkia neuii]
MAEYLPQHMRCQLDTSRLTRGMYSTDAGIYRVVPAAVFFPRNKAEAVAGIRAALRAKLPLTSRGAGTSCAGNAIGPGVVIDFCKHMNKVLDIDAKGRTARVQPGCVEATLQAAAAPFGLRFGPDPSSQNRCTIGGMVGNNACGPHATAWGRTAVNVLSLECVDGAGRRFTARTDSLAPAEGLEELIDANLATIRTEFGRFSRQVSGYQLDMALPEAGRNLAAFLTGTEGTLVTVVEIEVRLVPLPAAPVLMALGYANMVEAARDVPALLKFRPLSVEGLDRRMVQVVEAKQGPVPALPEGGGWLMCEVSGPTPAESLALARRIGQAAATDAVAIYPPGEEAAALWRIRADGAGLGGRTPLVREADGSLSGGEQAWAGFEDAAVPPEKLAPYLADFSACMKKHGINGLLYGHFGDGCVHVRLDFPLAEPGGVGRTRAFLEDAADAVAFYGGSISGEHGDGRARSELLKRLYSPAAISIFRQVKTLFDPAGLLNPGVIVDPDPLDKNLRRPQAKKLPALKGGFAFEGDHGDFTTALHRCTGVGKCRAGIRKNFMCPSFAATGREQDVTRGRARILEEAANGKLIEGFSTPEVLKVLDLCLACKACSADCPAGVDMAKYRSETYYRHYRGRLRPRTHYLLGALPRWLRLATAIPGLAQAINALMATPARKVLFRAGGLDPRRQMPPIVSERFSKWAKKVGLEAALPRSRASTKYAVLWADSFSEHLDSEGAKATVKVLSEAGYRVLLAPPSCCGLTWITTGQLPAAKKHLEALVENLAPFAVAGIPIVGVEPSCTAALRGDLPDLLPDDARAKAVSQGVYTLAELLSAPSPLGPQKWQPPSLKGLQVVAQPHCHHYSVMGWQADRDLLQKAGAQIVELSGCCGLAGNFGMEAGHYEMSVKVAENSLLPTLRAKPNAVFLADGFSCRTQARQLAGRQGVHLATLLAAPGDRLKHLH